MQADGTRFDELELQFIKETLDLHGEYVSDLLYKAIGDKKMVKSGELEAYFENNMPYKVRNTGSPTLEFTFPTYGRLAEIGYFRSKNSKQWTAPNTNSLLWGIKQKKTKKKDTRFYSKNVWGSLNRLIGILMYEYDEHTMERMKQQLQQNT